MKFLKTFCVATMLMLGLASTASAYSFNPASGGIQFRGPVTLVKGSVSFSCTWTLTVGGGSSSAPVTASTFTGGTLGTCALITSTGLPWVMTPTSFTSVTIAGVAFSTPFGNCGPGTITLSWSNGPPATMTAVNQSLPPDCKLSANLTQISGPAMTIVSP